METVKCPHCGRNLDLVEYETSGEVLIVRGVAKMPLKDRRPFLIGLLALFVVVLLTVVVVREWGTPARPPQATGRDWRR